MQSTADSNKLGYIGSQNAARKTEQDILRDSDAWFTPPTMTSASRIVLGGIDLDPFSSLEANEWVQATQYLTVKDDAFSCAWPAVNSVFMNPPYGRGLISRAIARFLEEFRAKTFHKGIVLVNNASETDWYQSMLRTSIRHCVVQKRISFMNADGKRISNNTRGQTVFFFVADSRDQEKSVAEFKSAFGQFGPICKVDWEN